MKAIFLDIDGTLVEPGRHEPPASAVQAIAMAQKAGHKVFLCTGRNRGMLAPLLRYSFDGVIGSSGGYVTCGDTVIYDRPMTEKETDRLLDVMNRNNVFYTVECRANSYTDDRFKGFLRAHADEGNNSELLRWQEQIEHSLGVLPLTEWQGKPVYKMVFTCERREQLDEPLALLSDTFGFCIQDAVPGGFING